MLSTRAYFKGRAYIKIILKNHARSYFAVVGLIIGETRYIHNDTSISTGAIIKKIAATSRKVKLLYFAEFLCCNYC